VAGVVGYLIARALSQPFRQLASAAAALGRGRFDLDLPTTGNPEARAIGRALEISGEQLRDRIEREQQFAVHASHVLRTPLTSLRLQLDELLSRGDLPDDARDAASRGLAAVEALETAAAELVALSRNSALVAGAEIPLRDLATALAQRWADALAEHDRSFTAAVEGDIELLFTPGPVETVLDLLLEEVIRHSSGNVRLVLEGDATTLRMEVQCKRRPARGEDPLIDRVRTVVEALGGRFKGRAGEDVSVLLPRR
jgi:signal transduction histidine kinase